MFFKEMTILGPTRQKNKYFKSEQQHFESRRIKEKKAKLTVEMIILGVAQLI